MKKKQKPHERLRSLIEAAGLSQRGAAAALGISERVMRYYCAGDPEHPIPPYIMLAMQRLAEENRAKPND